MERFHSYGFLNGKLQKKFQQGGSSTRWFFEKKLKEHKKIEDAAKVLKKLNSKQDFRIEFRLFFNLLAKMRSTGGKPKKRARSLSREGNKPNPPPKVPKTTDLAVISPSIYLSNKVEKLESKVNDLHTIVTNWNARFESFIEEFKSWQEQLATNSSLNRVESKTVRSEKAKLKEVLKQHSSASRTDSLHNESTLQQS